MRRIKKFWTDNSILSIVIILRRLVNKVYSFIFLKKYNINADYTSYIYGLRYMKVGSLNIGRNCRIEMITEYNSQIFKPKLIIGNRVCFNDRVHIGCANYIEIGDDCLLASNIYISDHNHGIYKGENISDIHQRVAERDLDFNKSVIIGNNVWIGEGVAVLPGAKIGNNSIIGSNAVVIGEIPSNCIAVGVPAKIVRNLDD